LTTPPPGGTIFPAGNGGSKLRQTEGFMKRTIGLVVTLMAAVSVLSAQPAKTQPMKPVLIVIDVQNAFLPMMSEEDKKIAFDYINAAIDLFRQKSLPVIRVYHTDPQEGPKPGSKDFEFPETVKIKADDPKVIKNYPNAFKNTNLQDILKANGCNTLFLCGLSATGCVLATYHGADDHDYPVYLIQKALISPDTSLTRAVERICGSIPYIALKLLLENAVK
jgi:nicotinamidase-related amidase